MLFTTRSLIFNLQIIKRAFHSSIIKPATASTPASTRNTFKPSDSRKTFLIDYYKHLFENNSIVLLVHRNNLVKADNDKYRQELKDMGANFTVIKNTLMKVYLTHDQHPDPASKLAKRLLERNKELKLQLKLNPLLSLLKGPTGLITISKCEPAIVAKVLKFLKSTNEKLFLLGGKVEQNIYNLKELDEFKNLKNKEELQLELVGVLTLLSGAGLVRTLETSQQSLYMTLKSHENELKPKEEEPEL